MRMVAPRTGAPEVTIAEEQEEYQTLVAALYDVGGVRTVLTRWRLSPEEIDQLRQGEDIYLAVMTFGDPIQPVRLQVGPEGYV